MQGPLVTRGGGLELVSGKGKGLARMGGSTGWGRGVGGLGLGAGAWGLGAGALGLEAGGSGYGRHTPQVTWHQPFLTIQSAVHLPYVFCRDHSPSTRQ